MLQVETKILREKWCQHFSKKYQKRLKDKDNSLEKQGKQQGKVELLTADRYLSITYRATKSQAESKLLRKKLILAFFQKNTKST